MERKKRKRSVIIEWLCSYILVLLIPVIAIFINYNYSSKVIKDEIIQANKMVLKNVQNSIDNFLEKETNLTNYVVAMPDFHSLISKNEMDGSFYLDVRDLKEEIDAYRGLGTDISYFLYLKEKDYIISSDVNGVSKVFHNAVLYQRNGMMDYDNWKMLLSKEYNKEFFISNYLGYENLGECLVYGTSVSYDGYEPVNLFFILPISELEQMVETLDDGIVLLLQMDEKTILAINNQGMLEVTSEIETTDSQNEIFETKNYMGVKRKSELKKINYCMLIPKKEFWKEARYTRNILVVSLLCSLVVGAICVYYLMRRNYRPISELLIKTNGSRQNGNEFSQIEESIHSLTSENKQMQNRILTQKEILLKNWLLAMMKGKYAGISKQTENFLNVEQDEMMFLTAFQIPMQDRQTLCHDNLLWFTIENVFSELMEREKMYQTEDGDFLFYLFVVKISQEENWKKMCLEKLEFLCSFIEENWNCEITAVISTPKSELECLRFMHQEIMDALKYQEFIGEGNVIDAENLKENTDSASAQTIGMQLETAIYQGNQEKMQALCAELFDLSRTHAFGLLRMQVLEVFQMIAKSFDNYEGTDGQRIVLAEYLTPMLAATNRQEMKKIFEDVLLYVHKTIHVQKQNVDIISEIRTFLEQEYTDSSLNISTIAEAIGKKSRYISKVYKEETGEGILDYLNELRINQAKLLLCTKKYTSEKISEMVGYASYKTFRRIFIKQTGITPGRFADVKEAFETEN